MNGDVEWDPNVDGMNSWSGTVTGEGGRRRSSARAWPRGSPTKAGPGSAMREGFPAFKLQGDQRAKRPLAVPSLSGLAGGQVCLAAWLEVGSPV
jgi:hypothetical protein